MTRPGLTGMVTPGVRRVVLVALACVVIVILLLPRQTQKILDAIRDPVSFVLAVPIQILASFDHGVSDMWNRYIALQDVYDHNLELQKKVEQLEATVSQLREQTIVSEQLGHLLDFQQLAPMETIAARVIGRNATNWYRALIIDKGQQHGLEEEMGVVTHAGVVGRVIKVNPSTAVVLLLTDPNVAMAGMIQRSRDEGIVQGTAQGTVRMKYLPPLSQVEVGDIVVTSGLTGDFPRGLQIGRIRQLENADADLFQSVQLELLVDYSKLEGVLVVISSGSLGTSEIMTTLEVPQKVGD